VRGGWRLLTIALAVLLGLVAAGAVGYRVFRPTETVTPARESYPAARIAATGVSGELPRAPLIVDGRLRLYAAKRQVWADSPVAARTETTPFWSYRRWPAEVVGVVLSGVYAVSKWSDGELVAIDVRSGTPVWRTRSPVATTGYLGGPTGATTVYAPPDLYTGRTYAGQDVVVSAGTHTLMAFDAASGTPLWSTNAATRCRTGGFTGPGFYADTDSCAGDRALLRRYDLASGRSLPDWQPPQARSGWEIVPLGCAVGRSDCAAARTFDDGRRDRGWLFGAAGSDVTEAPALAPPSTWLAGDRAVGGTPGDPPDVLELSARSVYDNRLLWTWRAPAGSVDSSAVRIVAAGPDAVYLISHQRTLVVLDPATGLEVVRTPLDRFGAEPQVWTAGFVYAHDRYVAIERLRDPGAAEPYLGLRPVLIAGG
jgi:outer membrane protein assembly factor BamB